MSNKYNPFSDGDLIRSVVILNNAHGNPGLALCTVTDQNQVPRLVYLQRNEVPAEVWCLFAASASINNELKAAIGSAAALKCAVLW